MVAVTEQACTPDCVCRYVSYVCESDDLYFEWDRDLPEFNISCLEHGSWDEPKEWPICLECK